MTIRFSVMPTGLTAPITSGAVPVEGVELEIFRPKTTDQNSRAMIELKFDVAEMSIAAFTKSLETGPAAAGDPGLHVRPPVRAVGHYLFSARLDGADHAGRGGTIGLPQYWISSCVWQRHVLERMHGDRAGQGALGDRRTGALRGRPAPGRRAADGQDGDLAALARAARSTPAAAGWRPAPAGRRRTAPAYRDIVAAEREFYQSAGVLPLMHVTVIARNSPSRTASCPRLLAAYARAKASPRPTRARSGRCRRSATRSRRCASCSAATRGPSAHAQPDRDRHVSCRGRGAGPGGTPRRG